MSYGYNIFIDIGCNVGAMTLSVVLRNQNIKAVAIDPNANAIFCLRRSLLINKLTERVITIEAAISTRDGFEIFDDRSSVLGHISNRGKKVPSLEFAKLINEYSCSNRCLVKIDVEGFEKILLTQLSKITKLNNVSFVIELHPIQFNDIADPRGCLKLLQEYGAVLEDLEGNPIQSIDEDKYNQIVARWDYV